MGACCIGSAAATSARASCVPVWLSGTCGVAAEWLLYMQEQPSSSQLLHTLCHPRAIPQAQALLCNASAAYMCQHCCTRGAGLMGSPGLARLLATWPHARRRGAGPVAVHYQMACPGGSHVPFRELWQGVACRWVLVQVACGCKPSKRGA